MQSYTMVRRSTRLRNFVNSCDNDHTHQPLWTNQIADVSSQESSEGEFVEEEKPWPPPHTHHHSRSKVLTRQVTQRLPRPHSHLFRRGPGVGQTRGSRHSRRWENCKQTSSNKNDHSQLGFTLDISHNFNLEVPIQTSQTFFCS